ncbi:MAG: ComEC/Rec2 family competence protein [Nanoarchaeota archaeon]|nr:ComEC/Rec2 family competence protein [Nanoarchaeota archaeon]
MLGTKQSLGEELKQDFIDTGIVHIVVLSGYNVTIVSDAIVGFFGYFLSGMVAFSLGLISIVFFAIMTGAGATIVRASIMAILVLIARRIGRTYEITRALLLAGLVMLIHNPWILVFDISFQLSFLATVGLIYLAPRFEKYVRFLPKFWDIRGIFAATIATQLFVLPFILYKMGTLSLVSPFVNLLGIAAVEEAVCPSWFHPAPPPP